MNDTTYLLLALVFTTAPAAMGGVALVARYLTEQHANEYAETVRGGAVRLPAEPVAEPTKELTNR